MTDLDPVLRSTAELMGRARSVLAYGGLDGVVHRPLRHRDGTYPQFAASADGYLLTDSMGNELVDWSNGWGPVMLGHRHPAVEQAIIDQLAAGPTLSLMHPVEIEVAELICELIPSAEMVAFGKNGSDAVAAAVRTARAATGRDVIVHHGFHGYHDWYVCEFDDVAGIPEVLRPLVDSFPYNDLDALDAVLGRHRGRVAAVLMEPLNTFPPEPGYLEGVRDLAHDHGALLVFDEVLTGFRTARGGAQEAYGVLPDLTCLGKAMGNGMPLSALTGRRELMALVPSVGYGITFRGETLSLAAARTVLQIVRDEPVNAHLGRIGEAMREGFERIAREVGLPCQVLGHPSRLTLGFEPTESHGWEEIRERFLQACLRHGVLTTGVLLPSYAHDQAAVDRSLAAMGAALDEVRADLDGGTGHPARFGGSPAGPRPLRATGFIEVLEHGTDGAGDEVVDLAGWITIDDQAASTVAIHAPDGSEILCDRRADRGPEHFHGQVPLRSVGAHGTIRLDLVCRAPSGVRWDCTIEAAGPLPPARLPLPLDDGVLYL